MTARAKLANKENRKNGETQQSKSVAKKPASISSAPIFRPSQPESEVKTCTDDEGKESEEVKDEENEEKEPDNYIPEVYKTQGTITYSSETGYSESKCLCGSIDEDSRMTSMKRVSYLERRNWITTDRIAELRKKAQDAIKHHKIFTIRGCFYSIRKSLLQRGWVEKLDIHRRAPINGSCQVILEDVALQYLPQRRPGETRRQHIQKCERNIMSRFLEHMPIDFLWSARKEKSDWIDMSRNPNLTINRFNKSPFTTKEGLCNILENVHWFFEEGKSETYFPRSYSVYSMEDLEELIEDYRLTACMSMLRFITEKHVNKSDGCVYAESGPIPLSSAQFALRQCKAFVRKCQHFDIDEETESVWNHDWEVFLMHFQMLTQEGLKWQKPKDLIQLNALMQESKNCLQQISEYWPQSNFDGMLNIWIVKPSNRCRGRGIHVMNDIKKIIAHVNPPLVNKGRYVVQKYMERPLVIHKCKFDIRQWFLVTSVQPLVIWMYKESYLRFSSQEYDLDNFHESVHLTNHAIQKHYPNGERDSRLPRENMWDCHTFQAYLRQIGKSEMWSERIYPGMKKALIGTMLASQDLMDRRTNTFELFGADFMISEDFQPWLIEINASPDLGATTSVTARLCPQCLEDIIKVVIDYRNDPKSCTGDFEMIYRQMIPPAPAYLGLNLLLKGNQMLTLKNFTGKKEKSKSDLFRPKIERKIPQMPIHPLSAIENEKIGSSIMLSPRLLALNVTDTSINKFSAIDSITSAGRTARMLLSPRKSLVTSKLQTARTTAQLSARLYTSKISDILRENISQSLKPISDRRHTSCGDLKKDDSATSNSNNDAYKIKCVGSKCAAGNEEPAKKSVIKPLKDIPSSLKLRSKANGVYSASPMTAAKEKHTKAMPKPISRNAMSTNKASLPKNSSSSHFCTVGLSLRAWQSKYHRIKTNQNDERFAGHNNKLNKIRKPNELIS